MIGSYRRPGGGNCRKVNGVVVKGTGQMDFFSKGLWGFIGTGCNLGLVVIKMV